MMEQLSLDVLEEKNNAAGINAPKRAIDLELQPESTTISEPLAGVGENSSPPGTCYFPCNREDALLLLGGLFISQHFPDPHVLLPIDHNGLFLVDGSLKDSEVSLLSGGRDEKFPLLIEVSSTVLSRTPRSIEFGDVLCLIFRNDSEADAFRFRPVDEFDPESLPFRVTPQLFGGDGEPRFRLRPNSGSSRLGQLTDRISAGLHFLMAIAEKRPACRSAALSIFSKPTEPSLVQAGFSISQVLRYGLTPVQSGSSLVDELIGAFVEFDGHSASQLLEQIQVRFRQKIKDVVDPLVVEKWLEFATDIINSRVLLSGEHLSDEKSIPLRAALLALIPETVESIEVFLEEEKPAGTIVVANAAFLAGLKSGLTRMSWQLKRRQAAQLGELARILFEAVSSEDLQTLEPFLISSFETDTVTNYLVSAAGRELVGWDIPKPLMMDEIDEFWDSEFARTGMDVVGQGRTRYSWIVRIDEGLLIEVQHSTFNGWYYPILKYVFADGVKLRKPKEIHASFLDRGHFWYFGESSGKPELSCDLPELPCGNMRYLLMGRLKDAIGYCVAPKKVAKPRAPRKNRTTDN